MIHLPAKKGRVDLEAVIGELGRREILHVLMEAGATLNSAALEAGIVDKLFLFYAPRILGGQALPVVHTAFRSPAGAPALREIRLERFGPDFAVNGYLRDVYRNH